MSRQNEIYTHLADFANESTSVGHDINNALSILMGYTENLSMRIESNKTDPESLNKIVEKLNTGIDRLQAIGKVLAQARMDKRIDASEVELSTYCHRWFKVLLPCFKNWNINFLFLNSTEPKKYNVKKWEFNNYLSNFVGQWFENLNFEQLTTIEVKFESDENEIRIGFSCEHPLPDAPTISLNETPIEPQVTEKGFLLKIPCKSLI